VRAANPDFGSFKLRPHGLDHRPRFSACPALQRLPCYRRNLNLLRMKQSQHTNAKFFFLLLRLRKCHAQQHQSSDGPTRSHHLPLSFPSTAAIMRPATPAAINPGRPCSLTSRTARGCSAGDITTAKPSPGAFFACVHGAVPVLAMAETCG